MKRTVDEVRTFLSKPFDKIVETPYKAHIDSVMGTLTNTEIRNEKQPLQESSRNGQSPQG